MVRKALDCLVKKDALVAETVLQSYCAVEHLGERIHRELAASVASDTEHIGRYVDLMFIVCGLESIAAHVANIAREVLLTDQSYSLP